MRHICVTCAHATLECGVFCLRNFLELCTRTHTLFVPCPSRSVSLLSADACEQVQTNTCKGEPGPMQACYSSQI